MIGPEYAETRRRLIAPLSGNSGWLSGPPDKAPMEEPATEIAEESEVAQVEA
jgi:hypothetical protein